MRCTEVCGTPGEGSQATPVIPEVTVPRAEWDSSPRLGTGPSGGGGHVSPALALKDTFPMRLHLGGLKMKNGGCPQQHLDSKCGTDSHEAGPCSCPRGGLRTCFQAAKAARGRQALGSQPAGGHSTCRGRRMLVPLLSTYYVQALGGTFTHMVLFPGPYQPTFQMRPWL